MNKISLIFTSQWDEAVLYYKCPLNLIETSPGLIRLFQSLLHVSGLWRAQLEDSISANEARYPAVRNGLQVPWHERLEGYLQGLEETEWGGTETIVAVAAIEYCVVTTYFEDGGDGFRQQQTIPQGGASKEIRVVYRLGVASGSDNSVRRVHYDSFKQFN